MNERDWTPESWRGRTALQQPAYPDEAALDRALETLRAYPPLVVPGEIETLKREIALAGEGGAFLLQGGACAERFLDCNAQRIANKLKILLQMSVILTYGARRPVVRIGRVAGQYAKPRSNDTETVDGVEMPVYRGDSVNSVDPSPAGRVADPARLLQGFHCSAMTLNHIRALIDGGFADLHHPDKWTLHSIEKSRNWPQYQEVVERILDAINFMESFGGAQAEALGRVEFYTSHEGLLLPYEEALTRRDAGTGNYYNAGAHLLWIGQRTRALDGAHVEFFRGVANPVGVKVGPDMWPDELAALVDALNPDDEPGRLTLITRLGAGRVEDVLPPLVRAVNETGRRVTWSCDPMHGNTQSTESGLKTRDFATILDELTQTFRIHRESDSRLSGVHFELTGDDVTECVGGAEALTNDDLTLRYETYCDPRLNYTQSLEMAFLIARMLKGR